MRRKALLLMVLAAGIMASCVEGEKDLFVDTTPPNVPIENYKFTRAFEVPVEDGMTTVVTYNGETIYEGNYPAIIQVPKFNMAETRSSGLDWHFVVYDGDSSEKKFKKDIHGVLMFEDVVNGDNDYNDFVCHIELKNIMGDITNGKLTHLQLPNIKIDPQAMGNLLPLKFGMEIVNKSTDHLIDDIIFYQDIRGECFEGKDGFINTSEVIVKGKDSSNRPKSAKKYGEKEAIALPDMSVNDLAINFYIIVNGAKHYTAESNKALTTNKTTPYGLFIPFETSFKYPIETVSIFQAYPNFGKWLEGENTNPFLNPDNSLLYSK